MAYKVSYIADRPRNRGNRRKKIERPEFAKESNEKVKNSAAYYTYNINGLVPDTKLYNNRREIFD